MVKILWEISHEKFTNEILCRLRFRDRQSA